jgi:hypothetical protein
MIVVLVANDRLAGGLARRVLLAVSAAGKPAG